MPSMKPPLRTIQLLELHSKSPAYFVLLAALLLTIGAAAWSVLAMEHAGHVVTGMDNQIVWGLPHVFAVFLVVSASGALNVASMASVFGKTEFKPLAPLSGLLAMCLLLGGLMILLLDLGRPDRLLVAITHFNFKSIFAWNIFLYSGFIGLIIAYLWTQMEHGVSRYTPMAGLFAFVWRMALTTGTGSIFGFLVARQSFDSALFAPLFIALSLSYGLAIFVLVLLLASSHAGRPVGDDLLERFARLQLIFIACGLYFVVVYHMTNLYFSKHIPFERFILIDGGMFTKMFWLGQIALGSVLPMALLLMPGLASLRARVVLSASLVIAGGLAQMYVTIVGGQAYGLVLFPGHEVSSSFFDGVNHDYSPSSLEWMLGLGGVAAAALLTLLGLRLFGFLPDKLDDQVGH
jgi:Ni/Fe-hydrogenase subunit HybB-like protein